LENFCKYFFLLILFMGCSHEVIDDHREEHKINPFWMKVDKNFSFRNKDDQYLIHPFYDVDPHLTNESEIRYVVISDANSKFSHKLDLLSGALYKSRTYCSTEDVWDSYSSKIYRPNFSLAIIPRCMNQMESPQTMIIFSSTNALSPFNVDPKNYEEGRIIGSVILESCESFPCSNKDRWKQKQILVGVNKFDPKFSEIKTFSDLKKNVDWEYTKAFLVNAEGSHQLGSKFYPSYRINTELSLAETMKNFKLRAKFLNMDEEVKKRDECITLYSSMWNEMVRIKKLPHNQQEEFLKFFKNFYEKDSKRYNTCQKSVRAANINEDPERHWFFAFVSAFNILENAGLYYSCYEKGWTYNPRVDDQHFYIDENKEIARCRAKDFELAFDRSINGMNNMRNQLNQFYRYVEYDSALGGSHQKIYSWIFSDNKKIPCEVEEREQEIFPQDVVWQSMKEDEERTIH
jgi:hypothetical protein